jgi:hypothetical protein
MQSSAGVRLVEHWKQLGMTLPSGCRPDSITAFETVNGVTLPLTMRDYYVEANGMQETFTDSTDPDGFCFWPLSKVVPVTDIRDSLHAKSFAGETEFFAFADYFQWSWVYAIKLRRDIDVPNSVILLGREYPEVVAASFDEFVDLYVTDPKNLYNGIRLPEGR